MLIALLFAVGVFVPALVWFDTWIACAWTLGLLSGYLAYAVTHHARWHARHHHLTEQPACYGVTTAFRNHVFGRTGQPQRRDRDPGGRWRRA